MDNRALLGVYFRQQGEAAMPDPVIDPALVHLLTKQTTARLLPKKPSTQKPTVHAASRPAASDLKSRLSSLRPVGQLMAAMPIQRPAEAIPAGAPEGNVPDTTDKRAALKELLVAGCTQCHLAQGRTKFVFGSGSAGAPVMVIGEAPGQEEDEQGLPFVGAAGKLLTTMLAAIGLDRSTDVFITNVLKCRPPENRNPETTETLACLPLLRRQIEIIRPKALLLLGRIAAHSLLNITDSIAKMRSKVLDYQGIPVMVIYHPAALLRTAEYKRPAWEDLQQFRKLLSTIGVYGSLPEK